MYTTCIADIVEKFMSASRPALERKESIKHNQTTKYHQTRGQLPGNITCKYCNTLMLLRHIFKHGLQLEPFQVGKNIFVMQKNF